MLDVSVIICTYNRGPTVLGAIESVIRQTVELPSFEILVVDNGSSDDTSELIRAQYSGSPQVVLLREANLGLSRARNAGLKAARGRIVAYLDDDAIAGQGWLAQIPRAFETGGPKVACVAGRVEPLWQAPRPTWLHNELLGYLSVIQYSPTATLMEGDQGPVGANMAFKTEVLRRLGGFSVELGRAGSASLLSNEEISVFRRLTALGFATLYDPNLCASHIISAARLNKTWFRERSYWQGRSDGIMRIQNSRNASIARALGLLKAGLALGARPTQIWAFFSNSKEDPEAFLRECRAFRQLGRIRAYSIGTLET
jgi:glycosyltransferase involved in cell wall biosynthesis